MKAVDAYFVRFHSDDVFGSSYPSFSLWDNCEGVLLSSIYLTPLDWQGHIAAVSLERYDSDRNR